MTAEERPDLPDHFDRSRSRKPFVGAQETHAVRNRGRPNNPIGGIDQHPDFPQADVAAGKGPGIEQASRAA